MGHAIEPQISEAIHNGPKFVGESDHVLEVKRMAAGVARRNSTVMILGETGSGKEMLARFVHQSSPRAEKPFIPVDCSSLSESLFESELFGHVKGAFTGANRESLGFFRAADGGTLFLDEIGELPLHLQSKLLRVLQERQVTPVGDYTPRKIDIRVVCATNRNLAEMVERGEFRQDLFFRLNVVQLNLPPLRHRVDDIVPLAEHFLAMQADLYAEELKTLSPAAKQALTSYAWPGNVREMANVMEHAHVLSRDNTIEIADLPPRLLKPTSPEVVSTVSDLRLDDVERRTIAEALRRTKGNKAAASRLLGINIQKLNRRIEKLNISA